MCCALTKGTPHEPPTLLGTWTLVRLSSLVLHLPRRAVSVCSFLIKPSGFHTLQNCKVELGRHLKPLLFSDNEIGRAHV